MNTCRKPSIFKNKLLYKQFYHTEMFRHLSKRLNKNTSKSKIIEDKSIQLLINAVFENKREDIFHISGYRYSLFFKNLVLEKYSVESEWVYVIHSKKNYLY